MYSAHTHSHMDLNLILCFKTTFGIVVFEASLHCFYYFPLGDTACHSDMYVCFIPLNCKIPEFLFAAWNDAFPGPGRDWLGSKKSTQSQEEETGQDVQDQLLICFLNACGVCFPPEKGDIRNFFAPNICHSLWQLETTTIFLIKLAGEGWSAI